MLHTIKNYRWVIATSLICVVLGLLTFFTFINQGFIKLNDFNLQILLFADIFLLVLFFTLIIYKLFKILKEKRKGKLGSETILRYILFFSTTTLLPSIIIAIFSLFLFNVGLQKYFDNKIKIAVNNSSKVAENYVNQIRNSIEADISLMVLDVNNQSALYYENPRQFLNLISSQRLLRRLDEVYLLDSSGNILMSSIIDESRDFVAPPEEAFLISSDGKPARIIDPNTNRTSALVKLNNFIDTYLYIVKFMDPKVINYLKQSGEAINFYYNVQERKTGIKITFAVIYLLIVFLLLFLSIILSINFASRLTAPIINLITASEKISSGDLSAKVIQIDTDKEFRKLNLNFNSMIKKLKQQQDKLLLSERHSAWETVARKLAHEIKNPLTPIQLSIDSLQEKYSKKISSGQKDFISYLETINRQIKDIENLVNEFSSFARMPSPIIRKINIFNVVNRAVNFMLMSSKTEIVLLKNNKNLFINGDEEQLYRVFINLIKNSLESIDEIQAKKANFKGKIDVDIATDNEYIDIKIRDNGTGIINTKKIMTPYYTTKKNGTGLGLPIVNKIISEHSGDFSINQKESGAEVIISLPSKNEK